MSNGQKEITPNANKINVLATKSTALEITPSQGSLPLGIEKNGDFGEVGMGVLSDGTPYLNQRGLAVLCGVENAHIGTISSQWNENTLKPRIQKIKGILDQSGLRASSAHVEIMHAGKPNYCYPAEVCLAVLEYYAFDAGTNVQEQARQNFRMLAGSKLREMIYRQVGYDPTGQNRFKKWHDRIALNFQSAPRGYFHVFNEAHTIVYELIIAGAPIGEKTVVDISIGQHWGRHWDDNGLERNFGTRQSIPTAILTITLRPAPTHKNRGVIRWLRSAHIGNGSKTYTWRVGSSLDTSMGRSKRVTSLPQLLSSRSRP